MRIVYVVLGKDIAGGETVCFQLMRAAGRQGHIVCVLAPDNGSVLETAQSEGFEGFIFPLEHTFHFHRAVQFARFLNKWNADLVHTHTTLPGMVLARLGARLAGVPIICHVHLEHTFNQNRILKSLQRFIDNITAQLCQIIAVSNDTRMALINDGNPTSRIRVISNGVALTPISSKPVNTNLGDRFPILPNTKIVGCVARLSPIKGQSDLLHAWVELIGSDKECILLFIGSDIAAGGKYEQALRKLAVDLGISDRVYFAGFQPDAAELVNMFDVFVLPSYREAMPMSILEAMAASRPVVATNVNGVPEVVLDGITGLLVPPGNPKALADAIVRLLRNPEMAKAMGMAGRKRVEEHFNLDILHRQVFSLYEEVTKIRHGKNRY